MRRTWIAAPSSRVRWVRVARPRRCGRRVWLGVGTRRRWGWLAGTQPSCVPIGCRTHVVVRWVGVRPGSCVGRGGVSRTCSARVVPAGCSLGRCRRWGHGATVHLRRDAQRAPATGADACTGARRAEPCSYARRTTVVNHTEIPGAMGLSGCHGSPCWMWCGSRARSLGWLSCSTHSRPIAKAASLLTWVNS